jgi:hypothetical protein
MKTDPEDRSIKLRGRGRTILQVLGARQENVVMKHRDYSPRSASEGSILVARQAGR